MVGGKACADLQTVARVNPVVNATTLTTLGLIRRDVTRNQRPTEHKLLSATGSSQNLLKYLS